MKWMSGVMIGIGLWGCVVRGDGGAAAKAGAGGCAVVELFTSEGCSSCPPADAVAGELVAEAAKSGEPVYVLAFHVDYWDRLGWKDPFSAAAFSARQAAYGRQFGLQSVYTPQVVVNGEREMVGSDKAAVTGAVKGQLAKRAGCEVAVRVRAGEKGAHVADVSVTGAPAGSVVNVAVVERGLSVPVERGENGGRVLRHENVVRWFTTMGVDAGGKGTAEIPVLNGVKVEQASVVAYVQEKAGAVTGATAAPLATATAGVR